MGANGEDSDQTTITNGTTVSYNNDSSSSGAVFVFNRSGSTWSRQAYIKAPNAETNDNFGSSVSLSGDTLAVGAKGEDSNQTTITNGTAPSSDNTASDSGAVYVFTRSGSTWSYQSYIKAPNGEINDNFGFHISLDGDTLVVAAPFECSNQTTISNGTDPSSDNSATNSGAVYVFTRSGSAWSYQSYIKASNAEANDYFGHTPTIGQVNASLSLSGDTLAVGAEREDSSQTTITNGSTASDDNSNTESGAVYVFKRSGNAWAQDAYIKAPNGETNDLFSTVSLYEDTLVVGANREGNSQTTITNGSTITDDNGTPSSGAVYVFKRSGGL